MPVDERSRRLLTDELVRVHGEEVADILMAHLPPVGWADVATKSDLDHLNVVLRGEMAQLSAELRGEMAQLSAELRGEMAQFRSDIRAEMQAGFVRQTRWVVGAVITCMFGTAGLFLAVMRLPT